MLKFALIGCGRIAKKHAEILAGGHVLDGKLSAVCDINKARAQEFGQRYEVPYYYDFHDMLRSEPDVDIVCVLTPSGMHAEHTIEVAKYKKHIVVEKPMALRLQDADKMIEACDHAGTRLFVVKQNRYNKAIQKTRKALEQQRFGKLVMGTVRVRWCRDQGYYDMDEWRGTWEQDGGVFANQASHHIDLLEWMLGEPISVFAKTRTALSTIETEDTGIAIIKFQSGALGLVEATTATRPKDLEGSLSLMGEKGTVVVGGFAVNKIDTWNFSDSDEDILPDVDQQPSNVYGFGHIPYLNHVVDCIHNNKAALVDGIEGRRSLELISAIYESAETGKEVYLRFNPQKCKLGEK